MNNQRAWLTIALTGFILAILAWSNPANAGQEVVIVCNPVCTPVVIITQDNDPMGNNNSRR